MTREERTANRAEVRRRRARVTEVRSEKDEVDYISVEFTLDNGERVEAHFHRCGWSKAPKESLVQFYVSQLRGPETVLYPAGPRGKAPRRSPADTPQP